MEKTYGSLRRFQCYLLSVSVQAEYPRILEIA